jgi:hypothetical protein
MRLHKFVGKSRPKLGRIGSVGTIPRTCTILVRGLEPGCIKRHCFKTVQYVLYQGGQNRGIELV